MPLSPESLAIASAYGLAHPPRPLWLGSGPVLRAYLGSGGTLRYLKR